MKLSKIKLHHYENYTKSIYLGSGDIYDYYMVLGENYTGLGMKSKYSYGYIPSLSLHQIAQFQYNKYHQAAIEKLKKWLLLL